MSEISKKIQNELDTSANTKNKLNEIKDIIYSEANNVLKYRMHYEGGHGYTEWTLAVAILNSVIRRISKLDPPKEWRVPDPEKLTKKEKWRVRENIRAHIRRNPDLVLVLECNTRPIVNS